MDTVADWLNDEPNKYNAPPPGSSPLLLLQLLLQLLLLLLDTDVFVFATLFFIIVLSMTAVDECM